MAGENSDRIRVVVADDDPIIRQLYESKLTSMGCDVLVAEDGGQAWRLLSSNEHIDLAIVDLEMPNVDGISLIQCARGHPRTKHLPITVVTSRSDQKAIQAALAAGATSFLTKPLQWTTFTSHIEYLMRLTHSTQRARSECQISKASLRIKDIVLGRTNTACSEAARAIKEATEAILTSLPRDENTEAIYQQIATIQFNTDKIEEVLASAQDSVQSLCAKVYVEDKPTALEQILSDALVRVQDNAQRRNISINIEKIPDRVTISCDDHALSTALAHLLENAIKYSPENSAVVLDIEIHNDGMLTITVNDEGRGMAPDFYAAILTPANEMEAQVARSSHGLGLPMAKAIAQAHGGTLEIRSMPNSGTSAMLVIPADRIDIESPAAEAC